jgi:hypothetical protein
MCDGGGGCSGVACYAEGPHPWAGGAAAGPGANSEAAAAQRQTLQELGLAALTQKGAEAGVLANDVSHTGRKTPWVNAIMKKRLENNNNSEQRTAVMRNAIQTERRHCGSLSSADLPSQDARR